MGNQASIPSKTSEPILAAAATAQNAGCPVKHDTPAPAPAADGCPVKHDTKNFTAKLEGGCPVQHDKKGNKEVYNVYGERIDPTNMMPYNPNQEPNDQQRYPLTTERVQSTIPKGGTEGTWLYPSEQMFFNALKRKGKGEDVHEGQMSTIVAIHNNMNERAWAQVEQYEKVCHPESDPKLLKFCGRPDTLTPLAWMKNMLGYGKPFDRHDWTIQRSDNTQQRYVIDYYFDEEKSQEDEVPQLHSATSVKSISMYARPAIDDVEGLFDRIKFPIMTLIQQLQEPNLSARQALLDKTNQEKQQDHENTSSSALSVEEVEQTFEKIKETCKNCFDQVKTCTNESQCSQAATALQLCMANIICKKEAIAFTKALEKGDDKQVEQAFDAMNTSLEIFQEKSAIVMRVQAEKEAFSQK